MTNTARTPSTPPSISDSVAEPASPAFLVSAQALREKAKLRRTFGRFHMAAFLVSALVGLDTLGAVASSGAQGFTWLVVMAVVFLVPYGLLVAELGTAFPEEGGSYLWTRLAFGRVFAGINQVMGWVSNPIWLGGSLTILAVQTFSEFFVPIHGFWPQLAVALAFIWTAILVSVVSFDVGRWIPTVGSAVRLAVIVGFCGSVVAYASKHGVQGVGARDFVPSWAVFIAVAPLMFFNYQGFELPSSAGDEMVDPQRDVPRAIRRAWLAAVVLYGAPILAILAVLPPAAVSGLSGFTDALRTVFTIYGGHVSADGTPHLSGLGSALGSVFAALFIGTLLTSGSTWLMGSDRSQAVAGFDGAAPRSMGRFSARFGTPIVVNLWSGVIATVMAVLTLALTGGDAAKYFSVGLGLAISTSVIFYFPVFLAGIRLRYSHPDVSRPFRVPGGQAGMWICGLVTAAWSIIATLVVIWPGFGTADPAQALQEVGFGGQRLQFELAQIVPLVAILLVGAALTLTGVIQSRRSARAAPGTIGGAS